MNVLVVSLYGHLRPHLETDLELIENHLQQGDQLQVVVCDGQLTSCDSNPQHTRDGCWKCIGRRRQGLRRLSQSVQVCSLPSPTAAQWQQLAAADPREPTLETLKQLKVDGFDLGYAVVSSLASMFRDPDVDVVAHADLVERLKHSAWAVYCGILQHLDQHRVDRVYVFNGRFAPLRAVLRACQRRQVECLTHERGRDFKHYALFRNVMPHDIDHVNASIRQTWQEAAHDDQGRRQLASDWFHRRAAGKVTNWKSFVADQQTDLLPANWNSNRRNVVVMPSSEDEFVAIGDYWTDTVYPSQSAGIREIIRSLEQDPRDLHLYIRVHPNLASVDNRQKRELMQLDSRLVTVIPPDAAVDSYALMKAADKVLTFGSTAGIEAAFSGTPSVLLARSFYEALGSVHRPARPEEVMQLLYRDLEQLPVEGALMYGHYFATLGQPYRHFAPTDLFRGKFKGRQLRLDVASRVKIQLHRLWPLRTK